MARSREFRVLVATDGSTGARAALATAVRFPWPARTRVRAVIARRTRATHRRSIVLAALDRGAEVAAAHARRTLLQRWRDADVVIVDKTPVEGILGEARRFGADLVVIGWRGHGAVRRLLMGSVSRSVVRGAACSVLVVRRAQRDTRRMVIGLDGSEGARRAVTLAGRLAAPSDGRVTLFSAVVLLNVAGSGGMPGALRSTIASEVKRTNAARTRAATKMLTSAAARLERRGWQTRQVLRAGAPLRDLLDTVRSARAHVVIVGARGTGGVRHLLLGSVAEGAVNRSPVPVLVVR